MTATTAHVVAPDGWCEQCGMVGCQQLNKGGRPRLMTELQGNRIEANQHKIMRALGIEVDDGQ